MLTGLIPWRRSLLGVLAITSTLSTAAIHAQRARPSDYDVKAAYLLNFGRFTTWPAAGAANASVFGVCVLGRDPLASALDAMVAGERIESKRVAVRRINRPQDAAGGCRILFVGASEDSELIHILQTLDGSRILTVSDLPQFIERGGMIQFVSDGNKIRFSVNVPAAMEAGLTLSSELLRVAAAVRTGTKPGA